MNGEGRMEDFQKAHQDSPADEVSRGLPPLGPVLVKLMKGVVYREDHEALWQDLILLEHHARDYVLVIGLDLILNEAEGFAYLHQLETDEALPDKLPRLVQRRPLSYLVSLLCVLLRKRLVEADVGGEESRVVLTRDQMAEMMQIFLKDQPNEARLMDQMDATINKVTALGFLRRFSKESQAFEVRRILKDLVNADWLSKLDVKLDAKLETYHARTDAD